MYTFHLFNSRGAGMALDMAELPHDAATFARSGELLDEHLSCDRVEVWTDDRAVVARYRHQPINRSLETHEQRQLF